MQSYHFGVSRGEARTGGARGAAAACRRPRKAAARCTNAALVASNGGVAALEGMEQRLAWLIHPCEPIELLDQRRERGGDAALECLGRVHSAAGPSDDLVGEGVGVLAA